MGVVSGFRFEVSSRRGSDSLDRFNRKGRRGFRRVMQRAIFGVRRQSEAPTALWIGVRELWMADPERCRAALATALQKACPIESRLRLLPSRRTTHFELDRGRGLHAHARSFCGESARRRVLSTGGNAPVWDILYESRSYSRDAQNQTQPLTH